MCRMWKTFYKERHFDDTHETTHWLKVLHLNRLWKRFPECIYSEWDRNVLFLKSVIHLHSVRKLLKIWILDIWERTLLKRLRAATNVGNDFQRNLQLHFRFHSGKKTYCCKDPYASTHQNITSPVWKHICQKFGKCL